VLGSTIRAQRGWQKLLQQNNEKKLFVVVFAEDQASELADQQLLAFPPYAVLNTTMASL
jgi:hypothetical protein